MKIKTIAAIGVTIFFLCAITLLCVVLVFVLKIGGGTWIPIPVDSRQLHTVTSTDSDLKELWSRSDIYQIDGGSIPYIAAAKGAVFLLGKTAPNEIHNTIIAIDARDEEPILWESKGFRFPSRPNILRVGSSALYAGSYSIAKIAAFDFRTGAILWSQSMHVNDAVASIKEFDDKVYVRIANYDSFILDVDTGEILEEVEYFPHPDQEYFYDSVFVGDLEFVWDPGYSTILAVDRATGKTIWKREDAASNPAATETAVYFLTTDGRLLGVDLKTGKEIHSVQFDSPAYGYVAVDRDEGFLYVWFSDNHQLLAFKIANYPDTE